MAYNITLQRCKDKKIRVCDKWSVSPRKSCYFEFCWMQNVIGWLARMDNWMDGCMEGEEGGRLSQTYT